MRGSQTFIARDHEFFEFFEKAGWNLQYVAELLAPRLEDQPGYEVAGAIDAYAKNGRKITRDVSARLNATYVTAIDRRDMLALAQALDNTIELVEGVSDLMTLYRVEHPTAQAQRLGEVLQLCAREVAAAIPRTGWMEDVSTHVRELKRLQEEGHKVMREATATLFAEETDPMVVLRWKDLYGRLYGAICATGRVGALLETIVVKNV